MITPLLAYFKCPIRQLIRRLLCRFNMESEDTMSGFLVGVRFYRRGDKKFFANFFTAPDGMDKPPEASEVSTTTLRSVG